MLKQTVRQEVLEHLSQFDNENDVQNVIHPELNFQYNSINLLVGKRGSGKTFNVFNEIVALCKIPNDFHLFVYVTKNTNDRTYKKFKDLITIPTVIIDYDESESFLKDLKEWKECYTMVRDNELEPKITDETIKNFHQHLKINDFDKERIHTLILYDDAQNVFKKRESLEYKMIFDNRHTNFTYFLCLQDAVGISTDMKAQLDSFWFFGEFPHNKFAYVFNQIAIPIDKEDIYKVYKHLNKRSCILTTFTEDDITVSVLNEDGQLRALTGEHRDDSDSE